MKNIVPPEIINLFKDRTDFCLIGHIDPDGDCIGSQLGLKHYLSRKGKSVSLYSPGPFARPDTKIYQTEFAERIPVEILKKDPVAVILDCSTIERIGNLADDIRGLYTVVIDHHAAGRIFGDLHYIIPEAPSVTLLIQNIIESSGDYVEKEEALHLFFGLCTDSGFFRHLEENSSPVFSSASRLIQAGASPKDAHGKMYGNKSLTSRIYLGTLLSRIEPLYNGRVLLTYQTIGDKSILAGEKPESDMLYQLLLGTKGCEAVILIREEAPLEFSVGLRASGDIDVGAVAASFDGGGHQKASGFSYTGDGTELKESLLRMFDKILYQ